MKTAYREWIGDRLRYFRTQAGLIQSQIAGQIGKNVKTYSHYEEGVAMPSVITLKALCGIYQITLDKFMEGSDAIQISEFEQQQS